MAKMRKQFFRIGTFQSSSRPAKRGEPHCWKLKMAREASFLWRLWWMFRAGEMLWMLLLVFQTCVSAPANVEISPHFQGCQMNWIDSGGICLYSADETFGLGFFNPADDAAFFLSIKHLKSGMTIWTANRDSPVSNSDPFVFSKDGNAALTSNGSIVWSSNTGGKGVETMQLRESGNLVFLDNSSQIIWQSFDHPTDTLLSDQTFKVGMKLVSNSGRADPSSGPYFLELRNGDLVLYANYSPPQPYWTMQSDVRRTILSNGKLVSAVLFPRYWGFYDESQKLLAQFIFSILPNVEGFQAAVLDSDGIIRFSFIANSGASILDQVSIPKDFCQQPNPCGPYTVCYSDNQCQCPQVLSSMYGPACNPPVLSHCGRSNHSVELVKIGPGLNYFANQFISPVKSSGLMSCQQACEMNCSCIALFFNNRTHDCFLYAQLGSLQNSGDPSTDFIAYIKVSNSTTQDANARTRDSSKGQFHFVVIIALFTLMVIVGLVCFAYWFHRKRNAAETSDEASEDEGFLGSIPGLPIRFSYRELQTATNNFSMKLGQGGFGSVYEGVLLDGTKVAVKQLESIGQGKKEFRTEVGIIGNIHHVHLLRLHGFCAEGLHRLLVYEYMANGSLDQHLFGDKGNGVSLNWEKRYRIALGTAKGLAYLHEGCSGKIIHCDIKPENVLLDENYMAKVSDFGLAKLMTREQSHVFTTLRGTRGYLAPEWLTNYAISEKSDVYSFGMVLLEMIGGRKNYDLAETSEKCYFPAYAYRQVAEGKVNEILDARLDYDADDGSLLMAVRVALWCIQEDVSMRPSMVRVVQMLEGVTDVMHPPGPYQLGPRLHTSITKSVSEEGISSDPSDCHSQTSLSAVHLSGPR